MSELYYFADGATEYRYTSADSDVIHDSETWTAIPISRSRFVSELEPEKQRIDISTDAANAVAMLHLALPPDMPVTVQIYQADGDTYALAWTGIVSGVVWSDFEATMQCESPIVLEERLGLPQRYQILCRYSLYSEGCQVDPDDYEETGTITSVSLDGLTLFSTLFEGFASGYFDGGHITWNGQTRLMYGHLSAGSVYITRPFDGIAVSDSFDAWPGCNHRWSHCSAKFDNLVNFGGFSDIPRVNPIGRVITQRVT